MKLNIAKTSLIILLLSLPFNFIIIGGIGNVYASTLIVLIQFLIILFLSNGNLINNKYGIISISLFLFTVITTGINILLNGNLLNVQITKTIIYLQNFLVIILANFYLNRISLDYFLKLFSFIVVLAMIRMYIEEPNHVLKLSTLWGERIEANFVAGVNTFAMLNGLALVISFFYIKNKFYRILLSLLFLVVIILTMSRGALIAAIFTLILCSLYDIRRETFNKIIRYSLIGFVFGFIVLLFTGKINDIITQISNRFLSFLDDKTTLDQFFAGRGTLIKFVFNELLNSSFFEILFGHGNGSMVFTIPETGQKFETSHFVIYDILYRNGLLIVILYVSILTVLFLKFFRNRKREKIVLFGLFVFFHLELLVNPMVFSAQSGWLYSLFLVLFIKQDKLILEQP